MQPILLTAYGLWLMAYGFSNSYTYGMSPQTGFVKIITLHDPAQAEVLRGLLEAQGMQVLLSKEAIGQVYGTFVGSMGEIDVYVARAAEPEARQLMNELLGLS